MSTTSLVRSSTASSLATAQSNTSTPTSIAKNVLPKINLTPVSKTAPTQAATPHSSTPAASTPGQWQHPRMQEVIERQHKTDFDSTNVRIMKNNMLLILGTFIVTFVGYRYLPLATAHAIHPYDTYTILLIRAFFTVNLVLALSPLLRRADTCEDIPLTPAQRQLLGLPPMSRPATPQEKEQWVTPPRYTRCRSATPNSTPSSLRAQISGSPSSGSMFGGTPQREGSGSPFSPQSLGGKGMAGGERRRLSYNARSPPLGASEFDASTLGMSTGLESTGTPTRKGNRASVGLNNKWLYEKGMGLGKGGSPRRSSNGPWDPQGWGTGSVFN